MLWPASHFDEDLGPVLVLLIGSHEQVTGQHRHQAIPLGLEVDGCVPPEEATQGLRTQRCWGVTRPSCTHDA